MSSPTAISGRKKLDLLLRLAQEAGGVPDRIRPRADAGPAPLSFGQERLWLVHQLDPGAAAYNVPAAFRLPRLHVPTLEHALAEVIRRHESLRTTLREVNGSPAQVVAPFAELVLPVEDLSALDGEAREAAVRRRAAEEAARPYDLSAGPLFRPLLLRLGDEDVLLLNLHHAVSDGWSMELLFRELTALYAARAAGRDAALPPLEVQYADFAVWQRARMRGEELERQLAYWKDRLTGAPALLELPTDHPRPAVQSFRGASRAFSIPDVLLERVRATARAHDATLFMALLGAFQVLLSRYVGSDDVVVGTPSAGRGRREVEGLIGFFVNTLVVRTDLSGDPSFREVLRRVRAATLGAFEHQEMPFEKLVAELQPERSLSHSPVFQVMFTLETAEPGAGTGGNLSVRAVEVESGVSEFDLTVELYESAHGLNGSLVYSTDLFEAATIERMLRHYARVLEQVADDPGTRLSALELLAADERRLVVEEWNRTSRPFPRDATLHGLFDAQVRARRDAIALVWDDVQLTYAELDARTNQLAHRLIALGVGPDACVGVLLERGLELIVSILAIIKAGGCYVPLDPTYPAERLRLMVDDAALRAVLTRSDFAGSIGDAEIPIVRLDEADISSESTEEPQSRATPESLAYIVYTSGSTGRPKGVMVEHRHVVQLVVETDYVRFGPGDRIAQASNASFDALAFEAWGAFLNGATLVGIPRDVLLSPPAMRAFLRDQRITTLYQTTALLNQLTREEPDIFAPLREVLFGGQAADADSVRRLLKTAKPQCLLHMYGPTETTAWSSYETVEHVPENALTVSVGRPTGNQRVYILDAGLRPMPLGVPGEAYVGGAGVVRGYLDRPGLTAERFVPDPFATEPGARMYRTGDRLRWKADGTLEFAGRLDAQVKIRGFRIEPGEIESALSTHPSVREARVIVREDVPGEARLVAYVVGEADADHLRAHLRRSLPEYMVPAAFVGIDRLPLTPNGKLDVRALPAPEFVSEDRYVEPRTPAEEMVAGIWAAVLRLERVGIHDNFFELGGHSLLATRVVSRVREVFGIELPLRALFEGPTVAEVAERVESIRREGLPIVPPIAPVERDGPLPLSFAQERLWFIDRLDPGSAAYNMAFPVRLRGALDLRALERGLTELVRRHEVLRTTLATSAAGEPVQVVHPPVPLRLPVVDLGGLNGAARESALAQLAADEAHRSFDLAAGPLLRATVARMGAEDHALLFTLHHVVSDGWSMGVLVRELSALYGAFAAGQEPALAPLLVQYADYAAWQRDWLRGDVLQRQLAYWRERLVGAPPRLELPTDRPHPPTTGGPGGRHAFALSAETADGLRELARSEGATVFMVLLAGWQALLARWSGQDDVVVGTPIAGRTQTALEGLIGLFVNTLALRADLTGNPSFRDAVRRVREATLGAYDHQDLPFEKLVEDLGVERSLGHTPLFQVMCAYGERAPSAGGMGTMRLEPVALADDVVRFDLSLEMEGDGAGIGGALLYRTALFDPPTIARMLDDFRGMLAAFAADPGVRIGDVELLAGEERDRVLVDWNRTEADFPRDSSVYALFEAQAARMPDAVAVTCGARSLTYGALDGHANRLAAALRERGVRPERVAGICAEPSPELLVGLMAILKAGGAFLPLDPADPPERIRGLLEDAGATVLLADAATAAALGMSAIDTIDLIPLDGACDGEGQPAVPIDHADPENLAYVVYTSGSTGRPKGVGVSHRSLVNYLEWIEDEVVRGAALPMTTRLTFDASLKQVLGPLLRGGSVWMLPAGAARDPGALLGAIRGREREGVALNCVPSLWSALLDAAEAAREPLPRIHRLLLGGEAIPPGLAERTRAVLPDLEIWNLYGPTEATVNAVAGRVERGAAIGRPVRNGRAYVLDARGRAVPPGLAGELYLGGEGIARGYVGRPALTAERFVPDPFAAEPGARLYRTGDRARWLADGTLEYRGRVDEQVKIRGFRVEPGEVAAALEAHPAVRRAAVVAREDRPGQARLVAYVVMDDGVDADDAGLREHLRVRLPAWMVPAAVVRLDALPLTPTGKLDRRALPAPAAAAGRRLTPETELEARIAAVWRDLLGVDEVGVEDNFFDLGGHSLLLIRLQARLAAELGRQVPVVELFQYPTVRSLAARLQGGGAEQAHVVEGEERGGARQAALARRRDARRRREG